MKYKDYYAALGVTKDASADDIKSAYRKLARKFHPDVSKEAGAEEKFKDISEAYKTLKDPESRKAYDELGSRPAGQEFQPPPDWFREAGGSATGDRAFSFEDLDLADLFAGRSRRGQSRNIPMPGQDYDITAQITLEDAFRGTLLDLHLTVPEYDEHGQVHRVPKSFKVRIPKGATEGQRLRLKGKGGKGFNGGRDGDLYLGIALRPHPLFRVAGRDLTLDLAIAPWEAGLGASVEVPTLAGVVTLKVPPGTRQGQKLRLAGRGLPNPAGHPGDFFAIAQIVMPESLTEREQALFRELADASTFNPRKHVAEVPSDAH